MMKNNELDDSDQTFERGCVPTILLVEDDEVDVLFFQREVKKYDREINLITARDGGEALDFLKNNHQQMKPFMIVTDLNMPGISGFEFIDRVRSDSSMGNSVIFVFSSSMLEDDITSSYERYVAGYICKQSATSTEQKGIQLILDYCDRALLPQ